MRECLCLSRRTWVWFGTRSVSVFLFFCVWLGGETDSKSERGGRQSDTLTAEGGEIRQEQVFFFFSFNFNTRMVFNATAWKDRKCLPETSGTNSKGEWRWDRPSSTLLKAQEGRCYSHTSHHHLLKRESSSIFHQVKLYTLEKCWTANVLRFFSPQWY